MNIEPILDADIIPSVQAGGIELGISFEYFKRNSTHIYKTKKDECNVL